MFAYVKCRCGRTLRARRSSDRTTIRCWDCRAEVKVPRFRPPEGVNPVDRLRGAINAEWTETLAAICLLALATGAVIALPRVGGASALLVLVCAALLYIRRIEEGGREGAPGPSAAGPGRRFARWLGRLALAAVLVAGLVAPAWIADGSPRRGYVEPKWPGPAPLVLGLVLWLALPMAVFALVARDEQGRLGPRRALAALRRKPRTALVALLLPPLAIAATEGLLVGLLAPTERLGTFVLDVFPPAEGYELRDWVFRKDGMLFFLESEEALRLYGFGLSRGATLVGSVPVAFRWGPEPRIEVTAHGYFRSEGYLLARLGITVAVMVVVFAALAIQSGLLGRVALHAPEDEEPEDEEEPEARGPEGRGEAPGRPEGGRLPAGAAPVVPGPAGWTDG